LVTLAIGRAGNFFNRAKGQREIARFFVTKKGETPAEDGRTWFPAKVKQSTKKRPPKKARDA